MLTTLPDRFLKNQLKPALRRPFLSRALSVLHAISLAPLACLALSRVGNDRIVIGASEQKGVHFQETWLSLVDAEFDSLSEYVKISVCSLSRFLSMSPQTVHLMSQCLSIPLHILKICFPAFVELVKSY